MMVKAAVEKTDKYFSPSFYSIEDTGILNWA